MKANDLSLSSEDYSPKLHWVVVYKDGTKTSQKDLNSINIDRKHLKSMLIVDEEHNIILTQHFKPGQIMIYRSRTIMKEGVGPIDRIHMLGWQKGEQRHIAFIYESDSRIECGDFSRSDGDNPWIYPIQLKDHDLIEVE
jgi:hypothetical protein